jgi:hypothetical protein
MSKIINIYKKNIYCDDNEFNIDPSPEFCNIKLYNDLSYLERILDFINECIDIFNIENIYFNNLTHGGFLAIFCKANNIFIDKFSENLEKNLHLNPKIFVSDNTYSSNSLIFDCDIFIDDCITISKTCKNIGYKMWDTDYYINIPKVYLDKFTNEFKYYLVNDILEWNNLINICIMVKNAGSQFRDMLTSNLPYIDNYTILDTGSTDDTLEIARDVLKSKKGTIYCEGWLGFRDSRNRLLDLAKTTCKYNIMLDDTYILRGDLRQYLNYIRGDQYADSFSLSIFSNDTQYQSTRITISNRGLRYIRRYHEVITDQNNKNVTIPSNIANILDCRFDYMETRTMSRIEYALEQLYLDYKDDPNDPRTMYYLGQTYSLIGDHEKAKEWFLKRANVKYSGLIIERWDAVFELARILNFKLNYPWIECLKLYNIAKEIDSSRPESDYYIGIHHYLQGDEHTAYIHFKLAFEKGYPEQSQYSLKPTLSHIYTPYYLSKVCYTKKDYKLGYEASKLYLEKNNNSEQHYDEIASWHNIYKHLLEFTGEKIVSLPDKPIICYVADGGYNEWDGENIYTSGVGGSETYIIEMARNIAKVCNFTIIVFCRCACEKLVDGVIYKPLNTLAEFVYTTYIHTCIVSRYTEYLPLIFDSFAENVYLVLHDLGPIGCVIPKHSKLKQIFCLTEWHVEYFTNIYPTLKDITTHFYYGIDTTKFNSNIEKTPYKFIYSSFANRGLLPLLEVWPKIYKIQPKATLDVYCDLKNSWLLENYGEVVEKVEVLLNNLKDKGVTNHGWVDKNTLANSWKTADFWVYPCQFLETFCLTALESAYTKTLVFHNNIGALKNTVGNRGIIIEGDIIDEDWKQRFLNEIRHYLVERPPLIKEILIGKNYEWAKDLTWVNRALIFYKTYIEPNNIEYKGMFNWTHDLPYGGREIFLRVLDYFNNKNIDKPLILEIGTYTGTSLISMVKYIHNSIGVGVDSWCSYNECDNHILKNIDNLKIEETFYRNVENSGLKNRIVGIKSNSKKFLLTALNKIQKYNIIYIDGSHTLLDTYSDLILSFELLKVGGLLIIDDYLFDYPYGEILERPYDAINKFLDDYNLHIKVLDKGYRVFLEKVSNML